MITTIEEAIEHAKHEFKKAEFVIVSSDGQIFLCRTNEDALSRLDVIEGDYFVVKGELEKKPSKKTKKETKETE